MTINEIVAVGLDLALELYAPVSGMNEKEKAAADAAVAVVAAGLGAGAVATANAVQVATAGASAVMDEADVAPDNPLRRAVSTGLEAGNTVVSGGASAASLARAAVDVAVAAGTAGLEAAGIEGASALSTVTGALQGEGRLDAARSAVSLSGAAAGAGVGASLSAASGSSEEEVLRSAGTGANLGARAGAAVGDLAGVGVAAPPGDPRARARGGEAVPAPEPDPSAAARARGVREIADLGVGLGAAGLTHVRADARGEADVERSLAAGSALRVTALGSAREDGVAAVRAAAGAAGALGRMAVETEERARARAWEDFDPRIATPHAEEADRLDGLVGSLTAPLSRLDPDR